MRGGESTRLRWLKRRKRGAKGGNRVEAGGSRTGFGKP